MKDDSLTGDLIKVGIFSSKLLWETTKFLAKNTPKAIVTVAHVKRELVDAIEDELAMIKKERQEALLEEKIAKIKAKHQEDR